MRIDCPVCGHYAHRKHACMGGMGDYCDCGHDSGRQIVRTSSIIVKDPSEEDAMSQQDATISDGREG